MSSVPQVTDQQVVQALISFYKKKGLDMSTLTSTSVFRRLPLSEQLAAIKTHAKEMHDNTSALPDWLLLGANSALLAGKSAIAGAGAAAGLRAAGVPISLKEAIGFGAGTGALLGLVTGAAKYKEDLDTRRLFKAQIGKVVEDPSTDNALGAIVINEPVDPRRHEHNRLVSRIIGDLERRVPSFVGNAVPVAVGGSVGDSLKASLASTIPTTSI
jgi:hypothetical protein